MHISFLESWNVFARCHIEQHVITRGHTQQPVRPHYPLELLLYRHEPEQDWFTKLVFCEHPDTHRTKPQAIIFVSRPQKVSSYTMDYSYFVTQRVLII